MKCVITGTLFLFILNGRSLSRSVSNNCSELRDADEKFLLQLPTSEPEEKYFEQKLDHFNKNDNTKWNQKYYREKKYYEDGGPVYLKIADKGPLSKNSFDGGYWHSHGKEKKAMLFYISHRFYDLKMPVNSAETKNLVYLNASQAIEDCIEFIKSMNEEHGFPKGTKWILFGASYAGTLAAWLRTRYPDLVHGAVASSAPVLARMNFHEYLFNVGKILDNYSHKCRKDIASANTHLDAKVLTVEGRKDIENIFRLCEPLDGHQLNISFFMKNMVEYISDAVLYDFEQAKVKQICDKMLEDADIETPADCGCIKNAMNLDGFKLLEEVRIARVLGPHLVKIISRKSINNSVTKTNELFGGLKLNTSRTLLVNGDADLWIFTQITSNKKNTNLEVLNIKGGSHCSDIYYEDTNKQEIEDTIKKIKKTLNSWLEK